MRFFTLALLAGSMSVMGIGLGSGCGDADQLARPELGSANVLVEECANTTSLKPRYWSRQGQLLDGLVGPSFTVQGARIGCKEVTGTNVEKSTLTGSIEGRPLAPAEFVGAALRVRDVNGMSSEIAVTQLEIDSQDASGETSLYTLVALDPSGQTVHNLCKPDADGRSVAVALSGRWDDTGKLISDGSISFHCTSGVIAKCVRWGYRPWQSYQGTSLAQHHQACTRMARADYCGDGQTETREGTTIDIYDSLNFHVADPSLVFSFEATWTPQGAYCVAHERWLTLDSLLSADCKSKFALLPQPSPIKPLDLCFVQRIGSQPQDALLSNRAALNIGL